ncbi:uncharacterized protein LOC126988169 [Eriocheir sinensis]|uniref:uncharacterized protein LOC126988169 n=1 Tax=Eriocheir sinensis TaxID=95602 RepID=UPI0021C84809|nr:uncharacterized protein LOC126988169 [Eriocheir sinensis]
MSVWSGHRRQATDARQTRPHSAPIKEVGAAGAGRLAAALAPQTSPHAGNTHAADMKCTILLLLALAAVALARPDSIFDISDEDMHLDLDIDNDNTYTGSYSWTSPEGEKFFVKYIADRHGYRILESNAVPATQGGVKADGRQVPFSSEEDDSFDNSFGRD